MQKVNKLQCFFFTDSQMQQITPFQHLASEAIGLVLLVSVLEALVSLIVQGPLPPGCNIIYIYIHICIQPPNRFISSFNSVTVRRSERPTQTDEYNHLGAQPNRFIKIMWDRPRSGRADQSNHQTNTKTHRLIPVTVIGGLQAAGGRQTHRLITSSNSLY